MAIAMGIDMETISELYDKKSHNIFKKRLLGGFRHGGLYNQKYLKTELESIFQTQTLKECKTRILITASSLTQAKFKVFNNFTDSASLEIPVADIVLSSTAAPSYFPPVQITGEDRAYVDGGLWANSPSGVGIMYAQKYLKVHPNDIHLLSIGTCDYKTIETYSSFKKKRRNSLTTIKKIIDLFFSTQESYDHHYAEENLKAYQYIRISSKLDEYVALDAVKLAKLKLPPLAEDDVEKNLTKVKQLLSKPDIVTEFIQLPAREQLITDRLVYETGLSGFYPSREHYKYRESAETLETYVATAKKCVTFVSVSLVKGINFDDLRTVLKKKLLEENTQFLVTISLLNPFKQFLLDSLATVFEGDSQKIKEEILGTATKLIKFRKSLPSKKRTCLKLRFHNAIPFGSAIIIDENTLDAKIQIETKVYKATPKKSFAFEVIPIKKDGFFHSLVEGYNHLIKDGEPMKLIAKS